MSWSPRCKHVWLAGREVESASVSVWPRKRFPSEPEIGKLKREASAQTTDAKRARRSLLDAHASTPLRLAARMARPVLHALGRSLC